MINENPEIFSSNFPRKEIKLTDGKIEPSLENIFEILRDIKDPEHSFSLEELNVLQPSSIKTYELSSNRSKTLPLLYLNIKVIEVTFIPTIPHCSMAGIIGLCIHYQLRKYLSKEYWFKVTIEKERHVNYEALNKQLNDKERVNAALENVEMLNLIEDLVKFY